MLSIEKDFTLKDGVYYQKDRNEFGKSILEDGTANIFMPATFRLYNSYECSQMFRFWIAINWMRESFIAMKNPKMVRVLDLGCSHSKLYQTWYNNGNYMNWPNVEYFGVDAFEKHLLSGRRNLKSKKKDIITHVLGDISRLTKYPKKFECIVSMETFEHIPKNRLVNLFKTAKINLAKGGVFIISGENPNREAGEKGVYRNSGETHHYEWPCNEVVELATKCGFVVERETYFHAKKSYLHSKDKNMNEMCNKLRESLPTSIVNNLICMIDSDKFSGKQWMYRLRRKED